MSDPAQPSKAKLAVLWDPQPEEAVRCKLCAFRCLVRPGHTGVCQVRKNIAGKLYSLNYHAVTSGQTDPIEKKPLFHFQPGSRSFSLACAGCNFRCPFCQNWQISQAPRELRVVQGQSIPPDAMVQAALDDGCQSMAYTYTEPTIFMEYAYDCARLACQHGLKNVFVSNGYMTLEAIEFIRPYLHAINVDLKAFTESFYREQAKASLAPVLENLQYLVHHTDIWTEVTTLVIPRLNDSDGELEQIARFIADKLKPSVPWHVSRFHPDYKMTDRPPTPAQTIFRAMQIGRQAGLRYVYAGNLWGDDYESTRCHACGRLLIQRRGYLVLANHLDDGKCPACSTPVAGVF